MPGTTDPALQAARERAIRAATFALVACEWGVPSDRAEQGFENVPRQQRERYMQMARTAFEAAEDTMRDAGYEWRATRDIVPEVARGSEGP